MRVVLGDIGVAISQYPLSLSWGSSWGSSWGKLVMQTNAVLSRFTYEEYITIFIFWHIANRYNYTKLYVVSYRPISQTVFMLSIAINRAEHVCATVIIKHNYMLMCNHKIVINIMLCLLNSTGHI